jgi:hypothetical protein
MIAIGTTAVPTTDGSRAARTFRSVTNRTWGYTRIQGTLANLHHCVARGTILKWYFSEGVLEPRGRGFAPRH